MLHHLRDITNLIEEVLLTLKDNSCVYLYEFSHNVTEEAIEESSSVLKVPKVILRLASTLHGLPRRYLKNLILRL